MFGNTMDALDRAHAAVGAAERELLRCIAQADREEAWRGDGARDLAHWLWMRYGISHWKALRWIVAARALEHLPRLSEALETGELGLDKVLELCRFASPEREQGLISWAQEVSFATVRRKADVEVRASVRETRDAHRDRFLEWWWTDDGRSLGIQAQLPAAEGSMVIGTLERIAKYVPVLPGEDDPCRADARRADALVALCSHRAGEDPHPATVVVHARLEGLVEDAGGAELEAGAAIHPQTVRRLLCGAKVQTLLEDRNANVVSVTPLRRDPPEWMVRQVRYRDRGCRFPGCGSRAYTEAHHVRWWRHGGRTTLENLLLIHELGWWVKRTPGRRDRLDPTRRRAVPGGTVAGRELSRTEHSGRLSRPLQPDGSAASGVKVTLVTLPLS